MSRPKFSTVLQQTKVLQFVVSRFANVLGDEGLKLSNTRTKTQVGRAVSALVQSWVALEESRLRLTKNANPLWPRNGRRVEEDDDAPAAPAAPSHVEPDEPTEPPPTA